MNATSKLSPSALARAAAGLAGAAVLALGMSACGSDSSGTGAAEKPTPTVKKEAGGTLLVNLNVVNQSNQPIDVQLCQQFADLRPTNCNQTKTLQPKQASALTAIRPIGTITYGNGDKVSIAGTNPGIGEPYVSVGGSGGWNLSEGEIRDVNSDGHVYKVSRPGDTDTKMLVLEAF